MTLEDWKDQIDRHGVNIPLAVLETAIETAPQDIRETPDYQYFLGMLDGRMVGEGVL